MEYRGGVVMVVSAREDKLVLCGNWLRGSYLLTIKRVKAREVGARRKNKSNVR